MPTWAAETIQSGINQHTKDDLTKYAFMLGGLDVTNPVLESYDPFKRGFARLFMVRKPLFVDEAIPTQMKKFKHMLEYVNTEINGISNISVGTTQLTGGYASREMTLPSTIDDGTNEFSVGTYELSGSPIREVLHYWVTGVIDTNSGLATYHGELDAQNAYEVNSAYHTAEFIYVVTDQTGRKPEYACLLANCFPKEIPMDHLNYSSSSHDTVPLTVSFMCTKYESKQINQVAAKLLKKYQILTDSIYFNGKISTSDIDKMTGSKYDIDTGMLTEVAAATK